MTGIHVDETEAITLTAQKNEKLVLIDHSNARQATRHAGLTLRTTIFNIITAANRKSVTKEDANQMLETLIEANFPFFCFRVKEMSKILSG